MVLIADGGSTKVDWACIGDNGQVTKVRTQGINPAHLSDEGIVAVLTDKISPLCPEVSQVHFFGAGLIGGESVSRMERCFGKVWPGVKCSFYSDVLASAIALFGRGRGIACILGTGSNSCLCDDARVVENVRAGGFILGDEGSGAWIGKSLLQDYIKGIMPEPLAEEFRREYDLSYESIVQKVYREPKPAAYMASLNMFAASHVDHAYVEELVRRGFEAFVVRNVCRYRDYASLQVGFVGSVAVQYEGILRDVCAVRGLVVKSVIKAPIDSLIEYFSK